MYRGQSGMFSWLFHRISGLGILLFLLLHIVDITLLGFGPKVYNDALTIFSTWYVRVATLFLIAAVFYHAYNGVRIILVDFWPAIGTKYQQAMFYVVLVATIASWAPLVYFIVGPCFQPGGACGS
ncbi:MAG TPA: succinate dehydrogenase, cytochrome b556 subunit [Ktedonobacterales bacterium]